MHVRSSESPLQSSSSMFLVMMRVTSCSSSLSLSNGELLALIFRVSWYSLVVFAMNVSEEVHVSNDIDTKRLARTETNESIRFPYGVHFRAI